MFVLAHLSDPHLAPLPFPHPRELSSKRGLGYINWLRKRRSIHRADMLAALVADLKSHGARPHRGDRRSRQPVADQGVCTGARLARRPWRSAQRHARARQSRFLCAKSAADFADRHWGDFMRGDAAAKAFPFMRRRGPLALIGLSTSLPTAPLAATGHLHGDQIAASRRAAGEAQARAGVPRHPDPSSAGRGRALFSPADECRCAARCAARARRRTRAARPPSRGLAALAAGPAASRSGGRRAVRLGRAGTP